MSITSSLLLRVGLGVTFIWIGILILDDPRGWAQLIKPWARSFLPGTPEDAMVGTGIFDIAIGALLIANRFVWLASLLGAMHLIVVFATAGFTRATVRNIGLLIALLALVVDFMPAALARRVRFISTRSDTGPAQDRRRDTPFADVPHGWRPGLHGSARSAHRP